MERGGGIDILSIVAVMDRNTGVTVRGAGAGSLMSLLQGFCV